MLRHLTMGALIGALILTSSPSAQVVLGSRAAKQIGGSSPDPIREGTTPPPCSRRISFSALTPGQVVEEASADNGVGPVLIFGVNFSPAAGGAPGGNPGDGGSNFATIFDSSNPSGGDVDLGTPNETFPGGVGQGADGEMGMPNENAVPLGNILIIDELGDVDDDGFIDDPDDADVLGSLLLFDFSEIGPVIMQSITIIDVEDDRTYNMTFFDEDGLIIDTVILGAPGDNGVLTVPLSPKETGVELAILELNGSGGFDDLCFGRDCDENGIADDIEIANNPALDMNNDGILDICVPIVEDCNGNMIDDAVEIENNPNLDLDMDGKIDACDCNSNGTIDAIEIFENPNLDLNEDGLLDECDCDDNGIFDDFEIAENPSLDSNPQNGQLDVCDPTDCVPADDVNEIFDGAWQFTPGCAEVQMMFSFGWYYFESTCMTVRYDGDNLLLEGTAVGPLGTIFVDITFTVEQAGPNGVYSTDGSNDFGTVTHVETNEVVEVVGMGSAVFGFAAGLEKDADGQATFSAWLAEQNQWGTFVVGDIPGACARSTCEPCDDE